MNRGGSYPSYHFPFALTRQIILSVFTGKKRNIRYDAQKALTGINPPIHIIGNANIPQQGPALLTMNHYARPGFSVVWAALSIASQLPTNQLWLMTSAWTNRIIGLDLIRTLATRVLFKRIAAIYGMVTTPPMPPIESELQERAASIRKILQHFDLDPKTIMCIAPEGRDFAEGTLGMPARGTGKFIQYLAMRTKVIVPVGAWEGCGKLIIHFGNPYGIEDIINKDDEAASIAVMHKIAQLLPTRIRKNIPGERCDENK